MNTSSALLVILASLGGASALAPSLEPTPVVLAQDDPLKLIRDKDPEVREKACAALGELADEKGDALLIKAAEKDEDPGVALAAIAALTDRPGSKRDKSLIKAIFDSPFDRVAMAAARRLSDGDSAAARKALAAKAKGKTALRASLALLELEVECHGRGFAPGETKDVARDLKRLEKLGRSKDVRERAAAAGAAIAMTRGDKDARGALLEPLLSSDGKEKSGPMELCAALDALGRTPGPTDLWTLVKLPFPGDQPGVVLRRYERAIGRSFEATPGDQWGLVLAAFINARKGDDAGLATMIRSLGHVRGEARGKLPIWDDAQPYLEEAGPLTAAAIAGLMRQEAAQEDPLLTAPPTFTDGGTKAGYQFVGAVGQMLRREEPGSDGVGPMVDFLAQKLSGQPEHITVAAAVALGCEAAGEPGATALIDAAGPKRSPLLRVAALVSLGATRQDAALETLSQALSQALSKGDHWTLRAAAAQGLRMLSKETCVEPLAKAATDANPSVAATAIDALRWFAGSGADDVEPADWTEWWKTRPGRGNFKTRAERDELAEAYGYGVSDAEIYAGLDVVVVPGRGDNVEAVLDRLGIAHRTAAVGKLEDAALTPESILLVGCTGEVSPGDVQVIRWFVNAGGALFTSCWALSHTVAPAFPAVVSKAASPGEVMDTVFAERAPGAEGSPYLRGVFDGGVRPFYSLVGAHLIHVVDPERAHVLLDSPECASRHGSGTLAVWFEAGHGVVLDTANHLEEQGFASAVGLSRPEDRQAFAVNHLGMTIERLRECADEKWWRGTSSAAEQVSDLSVFRILTGFVRQKRIGG